MFSILEQVLSKFRINDFHLKNIEAYELHFPDQDIVDYQNYGRQKHLLHLVTSGKRIYTCGEHRFSLKSKSLILIPEGTTYTTTSHSENGIPCSGIGISFCCNDLFSEEEKAVYYLEDLVHYDKIKTLFETVLSFFTESPLDILLTKTALYQLLSYLIHSIERNSEDALLLKPAIDYFSATYCENLPIKDYAIKCSLSESYFRKKFTRYTGVSPIEYRNNLRFALAKRLYREGMSSSEIAEKTGFCDARHLLKLYKSYTGNSLKENSKWLL